MIKAAASEIITEAGSELLYDVASTVGADLYKAATRLVKYTVENMEKPKINVIYKWYEDNSLYNNNHINIERL